jgi:drug/metabolite transporter (DMT)-like permease
MNPKLVFIILTLIAVSLEVVGDFSFKKWAIESRWPILVIGLAIYFIGTIFWAYSLKFEFLSRGIVIFTLLNLFLSVLVGVLYFKEELTLTQEIGIILAIISIILIEL